jgi:hypothetical protein
MGQTQHRATEVAKTLGRYIKADLAEGLSLALINGKFPGMTRDELSRVLAICKDEATLEYERTSQICCRRLLNAAATNLTSTSTKPIAIGVATPRLLASKDREGTNQASRRSSRLGTRAVAP